MDTSGVYPRSLMRMLLWIPSPALRTGFRISIMHERFAHRPIDGMRSNAAQRVRSLDSTGGVKIPLVLDMRIWNRTSKYITASPKDKLIHIVSLKGSPPPIDNNEFLPARAISCENTDIQYNPKRNSTQFAIFLDERFTETI